MTRNSTFMQPVVRGLSQVCVAVACAALWLAGSTRPAAAVEVVMMAQVGKVQVDENDVISWVFNNHGTIESVRNEASELLNARIRLVDRACSLSDEQRRKLTLAGRGDIHRFFTRFEAFRRTVRTGSVPQDEWQQMWQRLQPIQTEYQRGLHHPDSLFVKSIRPTLDTEQFAALQEFERRRDERYYLAMVKGAIAMIENDVPLTIRQRQQLLDTIMAEGHPQKVNWNSQYKFYFVLYQISLLPEEKLKPIFLENEWQVVSAILRQGRAYKQIFEQQGIVLE